MPSHERRRMGTQGEPLTDKDRARLIGRADARINQMDRDELLALHVATGTRLARLTGFDENEAPHIANAVTLALVEGLLDKNLRRDMDTASGRRNVR